MDDSGVAVFLGCYVDYFAFEIYVFPFELPDFSASCAGSLSSCRKVAMRLVQPAVSWSISISFGMNGSLRMVWYKGGFHVPLTIFRNDE